MKNFVIMYLKKFEIEKKKLTFMPLSLNTFQLALIELVEKSLTFVILVLKVEQ